MTYRQATRADLKPGAVFVVRDDRMHSFPLGTRVVVSEDDNTDMPRFMSEADCNHRQWVWLGRLEPVAPATVSVPRELAEEFVRTHGATGLVTVVGAATTARASLRALFAATLAPPIPQDEADARSLLEARGYTVSKREDAA